MNSSAGGAHDQIHRGSYGYNFSRPGVLSDDITGSDVGDVALTRHMTHAETELFETLLGDAQWTLREIRHGHSREPYPHVPGPRLVAANDDDTLGSRNVASSRTEPAPRRTALLGSQEDERVPGVLVA
jgi:hypothetical protein